MLGRADLVRRVHQPAQHRRRVLPLIKKNLIIFK